MHYGFYLPTRGQTTTPDDVDTLVQRGEAYGFHSVMIADHIVFPTDIQSPYPYTVSGTFPGHGDAMEQLTLMAFVAAKTTRLAALTAAISHSKGPKRRRFSLEYMGRILASE